MSAPKSVNVTKVPRLPVRTAFTGPEFVGCIGTGRRIQIRHLGITSGSYVVGVESDVDDVTGRNGSQHRLLTQLVAGKRVIRWSGKVIYQFQTRAAAVAKFHELNQNVVDFNYEQIEQHRKYRSAVKRGDIATALACATELLP